MSDFYRNQPDPGELYGTPDQQVSNDSWGEEPFYGREEEASYDAYEQPAAQPEQQEDPYAAWRRPGDAENFLTADPAPFGAELQQGGVPLYSAEQGGEDYRTMGDAAPTRIGRPVQQVNKRTTVVDNAAASFVRPQMSAQTPEQAAQPARQDKKTAEQQPVRRRSRMERRVEEEPQAAPNVAAAAPSYDPFDAGDSEMASVGGAEPQAAPRTAIPGGRYIGARTATPSSAPQGVAAKARNVRDELKGEQQLQGQPVAPQRRPVASAPTGVPQRRPAAPTATGVPQRRPVPPSAARPQGMGRPPVQQGGVRQPAPQAAVGNRPVPRDANGRPIPQGAPVRRPMPQGGAAAPVRRPAAPNAVRPTAAMDDPYAARSPEGEQTPYAYRAKPARNTIPVPMEDSSRMPVNRKPYDFEKEGDEPPRRKGGVLVPLIIVLLVIGGLLAAICLPNWENVGGIGTTMGAIKGSVVSVFSSVKNMIAPEEEPIKSFIAATSDLNAPASLRLTLQTSKNIAGVRITDDMGNTIYSRDYDDQLTLSGEAIENSNALIWTPVCTIEDAYSGGFTAYAVRKDGTETEGTRSESIVNIAAPKVVVPPMQSFSSDTTTAAVPATVSFTLITSTDVTAVRVVDQYNSPVASMTAAEAGASLTESGETRTWQLTAEVAAAYTGNYAAQYQTEADSLNYTDSGYSVYVELTAEAAPTQTPAATTETNAEGAAAVSGNAAAQSGDAGVATLSETGAQPVDVQPTSTPEPTPAPTEVPVPESTPLPALTVTADESALPTVDTIKLKSTIISDGKTVESYSRTKAVSVLNPFTTYNGGSDYAIWKQAGVLTFRSGPMRQNAAYGTVEVENAKLSEVWSQEVGSMKVSSDTLYGVNAPGQAVIVKWPAEVRQRMGILDAMKDVTALKEVIVAAQDGKIYFYNLLDGEATREAYDLGAPSAGGLSIATNGTPVLGVGQSHSKLANKTVDCGYHLINLLTNKEALLVETDGKERSSNYSGVLGAAVFDNETGSIFFGSQGGVIYSVELGKQSETYDYQAGKVSLSSSTQAYKSTAKGQENKQTNIDASVAMYNNYLYYGDRYGIVRCLDVNTMTPVWAIATGDNISATPALDMEDESTVALYTGNTILNQRKDGVCTIRRVNALTGVVDWSYEVPDVKKQSDYDVGVEASPVVGQENISDLVIFTVTNGANGSRVIALDKKKGSVEWQADFTAEAVSSPVAVYNEDGDAWLVQAMMNGEINLLNAKTGEVLDTLALDTQFLASPAVYGNLMVISSSSKAGSAVYCIKID